MSNRRCGCPIGRRGVARISACWLALLAGSSCLAPALSASDRPGGCSMVGGVPREAGRRDAEIIAGGPFTGAVVVAAYTSRGGDWVCSRWCPTPARGAPQVSSGRRLVPRYH